MAAARKLRLRSGFNFRPPAGWDALSSVYEISMGEPHEFRTTRLIREISRLVTTCKECFTSHEGLN